MQIQITFEAVEKQVIIAFAKTELGGVMSIAFIAGYSPDITYNIMSYRVRQQIINKVRNTIVQAQHPAHPLHDKLKHVSGKLHLI